MPAPRLRLVVELTVGLVGAWLLSVAFRADAEWFARHVLLFSFRDRPRDFAAVARVRQIVAALGLLILVGVRPLAGRLAARHTPRSLALRLIAPSIAVLLAFAVVEVKLRAAERNIPTERMNQVVRLGVPDARAGWQYQPSHTTRLHEAGRELDFVVNAESNRAAREDDNPDFGRPSILFAGESFTVGQGLRYDETFPALVGARMHRQTVNLAVHGYGSDQAYLRLIDALPKYAQPVAVVTTFLAGQMDRALADNRPHLVLDEREQLRLEPPWTGFFAELRLRRLCYYKIPYYSDAGIERAFQIESVVLRETAARARDRGAAPLFVVITWGPARPLDAHPEAFVVRRLFVEPALPYVLVDIDPSFTLGPDDGHPNARGAEVIADAVTRALAPLIGSRPTP